MFSSAGTAAKRRR